jgi:hypothetical protein
MKRITSLVAILAAVMALAAAFSAASASADTVICDSIKTPCQLEEVKPTGSTVITGNYGQYLSFRIAASGMTEYECPNNTMIAQSKTAFGNPLAANFDGTLSGCRQATGGKLACTGSMNEPKTTLEAAATGGTMKIGSSSEPLAVTLECGTSPITCTYKAKDTFNLDVQAGGAKALQVPMYLPGGTTPACNGSSPRLTVENISEGDYISKYTPTGSVICKTAEEPCINEANRYGAGTSLGASPETKAAFTNPIYKTECTSSSLTGQLTGAGGVGQNVPFELTSASFTGCSNSATVSVEGLPWHGTIAHGAAIGEGSLYMTDVKLKFVRLGVVCYYGGNVSAKIQSNSKLLFNPSSLQVLAGSSGLCGPLGTGSGSLSASYGLTAPNPFYVTWL